MTLATRLRIAGGGSSVTVPPPTFPTSWNVTRYAGNPIIVTAGGETAEQYDPAPYELPNGDIHILVKGGTPIYSYLSTDGGETFAGENGGSAVIVPGSGGAWDDTHALEPAVLYDSAANVIRAYYKGSGDGGTTWGWGYATAPGATPLVFTKDAGNPILTAAAIGTEMGGTVSDTAPFDVVFDGTDHHFYGYVALDSVYQIIHMTGSDWDAPDVSTVTALLVPPSSATLAATGSVFRMPVSGPTLYGMFYTWGPVSGSGRSIRVGQSTALASGWDFSDTTDILAVATGWEVYHVYTPRLLRDDTLLPLVDGTGRWRLYYSGADAGWVHSQTGLAYLAPS